jgi:hypothetical protein
MKRLKTGLFLVALLSAWTAAAQVRTAGDIDAQAFVIGLDSYVYHAGPLEWDGGGSPCRADVRGQTVVVGSSTLSFGTGDLQVGVHDFTADRQPELVVGERLPAGIRVHVYALRGGSWQEIGNLGIPGGTECRIFRQALPVKDPATGVLHAWTWHGDRFDYKSSESGSSF